MKSCSVISWLLTARRVTRDTLTTDGREADIDSTQLKLYHRCNIDFGLSPAV